MRTTSAAFLAALVLGVGGCTAADVPTAPESSSFSRVVMSGLVFEMTLDGAHRLPVADVDVFLMDYFGDVLATTRSKADGTYTVQTPASLRCTCYIQLEAEKAGFHRSLTLAGEQSSAATANIEMFRGEQAP